jgi:Protein of unknown function (DUF3489)
VPKLSQKQLLLLTAAAGRPDGKVLPAPETLRLRDAALDRTLKALLDGGLITELPGRRRVRKSNWAGPDSETRPRGRLVITPAGLAALDGRKAEACPAAPEPVPEHPGAEVPVDAGEVVDATAPTGALPAPDTPPTLVPPPGGKLGLVLRVVSQVDGATIEEIAGATNWLRHTSRAALTRLRQRGFDIRAEQVDGRRGYRLHGAA